MDGQTGGEFQAPSSEPWSWQAQAATASDKVTEASADFGCVTDTCPELSELNPVQHLNQQPQILSKTPNAWAVPVQYRPSVDELLDDVGIYQPPHAFDGYRDGPVPELPRLELDDGDLVPSPDILAGGTLSYSLSDALGITNISGMNKDGQDWLFPNLDPQPGGMENNGRAGVTMEVAIERFETLHETLVHDAALGSPGVQDDDEGQDDDDENDERDEEERDSNEPRRSRRSAARAAARSREEEARALEAHASDADDADSSRKKRRAKASQHGKMSAESSQTEGGEEEEEEEEGGAKDDDESESDNPDKPWCLCAKPHDNRFMIACDRCTEWYHGDCVGVTKARGRQIEKKGINWICPVCSGTADMPQHQKARVGSASSTERDSIAAEDVDEPVKEEEGPGEDDQKEVDMEEDDKNDPSEDGRVKRKRHKRSRTQKSDDEAEEEDSVVASRGKGRRRSKAPSRSSRKSSETATPTKGSQRGRHASTIPPPSKTPANTSKAAKSAGKSKRRVVSAETIDTDDEDDDVIARAAPRMSTTQLSDAPAPASSSSSSDEAQAADEEEDDDDGDESFSSPSSSSAESAEEEQSIEDDTEADKDFVVDDVKKRKHGKDAGSTGKRRRGGSSKASADNAITSPKVRRQNKKSSTKTSKKNKDKTLLQSPTLTSDSSPKPVATVKCLNATCTNLAEKSGVYCSVDCLIKHSRVAIKIIQAQETKQRKVKKTPGVPPSVPVREKKNQPSAVPPTVPAVSSTSDDLPKTSPASQSKTESSNNASGLLPTPIVPDSVSGQSRVAPPFRHRTERVSVVDRITGQILVGMAAPTKDELRDWLDLHPTYEVMKPETRTSLPKVDEQRPLPQSNPAEDPEHESWKEAKEEAARKERAQRNRVFMSIKDILTNRCRGAPELKVKDETIQRRAQRIEDALFALRHDTRLQYRAAYGRIAQQLQTTANPGLFRQVITGHLRAKDLVRMSAAELTAQTVVCWKPPEVSQQQAQESSSLTILDTTSQHGTHHFDMNCRLCQQRREELSAEGPPSPGNDVDGSPMAEDGNTENSHALPNSSVGTASSLQNALNSGKPIKILRPAPDPKLEPEEYVRYMDSLCSPDDSSSAKPSQPSPDSVSHQHTKVCVWKGFIQMTNLTKFSSHAYLVSGPSDRLMSLLPGTIHLSGRMKPEELYSYLGGLKKSHTRDVCLVYLEPTLAEERSAYTTLYQDLYQRGRCGVYRHGKQSAIHNIYLLPLSDKDGHCPSALLPFDGPGLPPHMPQVLVAVIVRSKVKRRSTSGKESAKKPHLSDTASAGVDIVLDSVELGKLNVTQLSEHISKALAANRQLPEVFESAEQKTQRISRMRSLLRAIMARRQREQEEEEGRRTDFNESLQVLQSDAERNLQLAEQERLAALTEIEQLTSGRAIPVHSADGVSSTAGSESSDSCWPAPDKVTSLPDITLPKKEELAARERAEEEQRQKRARDDAARIETANRDNSKRAQLSKDRVLRLGELLSEVSDCLERIQRVTVRDSTRDEVPMDVGGTADNDDDADNGALVSEGHPSNSSAGQETSSSIHTNPEPTSTADAAFGIAVEKDSSPAAMATSSSATFLPLHGLQPPTSTANTSGLAVFDYGHQSSGSVHDQHLSPMGDDFHGKRQSADLVGSRHDNNTSANPPGVFYNFNQRSPLDTPANHQTASRSSDGVRYAAQYERSPHSLASSSPNANDRDRDHTHRPNDRYDNYRRHGDDTDRHRHSDSWDGADDRRHSHRRRHSPDDQLRGGRHARNEAGSSGRRYSHDHPRGSYVTDRSPRGSSARDLITNVNISANRHADGLSASRPHRGHPGDAIVSPAEHSRPRGGRHTPSSENWPLSDVVAGPVSLREKQSHEPGDIRADDRREGTNDGDAPYEPGDMDLPYDPTDTSFVSTSPVRLADSGRDHRDAYNPTNEHVGPAKVIDSEGHSWNEQVASVHRKDDAGPLDTTTSSTPKVDPLLQQGDSWPSFPGPRRASSATVPPLHVKTQGFPSHAQQSSVNLSKHTLENIVDRVHKQATVVRGQGSLPDAAGPRTSRSHALPSPTQPPRQDLTQQQSVPAQALQPAAQQYCKQQSHTSPAHTATADTHHHHHRPVAENLLDRDTKGSVVRHRLPSVDAATRRIFAGVSLPGTARADGSAAGNTSASWSATATQMIDNIDKDHTPPAASQLDQALSQWRSETRKPAQTPRWPQHGEAAADPALRSDSAPSTDLNNLPHHVKSSTTDRAKAPGQSSFAVDSRGHDSHPPGLPITASRHNSSAVPITASRHNSGAEKNRRTLLSNPGSEASRHGDCAPGGGVGNCAPGSGVGNCAPGSDVGNCAPGSGVGGDFPASCHWVSEQDRRGNNFYMEPSHHQHDREDGNRPSAATSDPHIGGGGRGRFHVNQQQTHGSGPYFDHAAMSPHIAGQVSRFNDDFRYHDDHRHHGDLRDPLRSPPSVPFPGRHGDSSGAPGIGQGDIPPRGHQQTRPSHDPPHRFHHGGRPQSEATHLASPERHFDSQHHHHAGADQPRPLPHGEAREHVDRRASWPNRHADRSFGWSAPGGGPPRFTDHGPRPRGPHTFHRDAGPGGPPGPRHPDH